MSEPLTLLAVHAHPDDEAIGTGGTFCRYSAEGIRVVLVCCTLGEAGEILDPSLDPEEARPRLGQIRERELSCACQVLGVHELNLLGYRDSGMAGTADNDHPASFHRADSDEATARLVRIVRQVRPQVLVSYGEDGTYGHPDHLAAHRITVAAFEAAADARRFPEAGSPVWQPQKLYFTAIPRSRMERLVAELRRLGVDNRFDDPDRPRPLGTPDELITTRVDVRAYLARKREAMRCHRTQLPDDSFFFNIPEPFAIEAFGHEHYVRARSLVPISGGAEEDLFVGLR